MTEIADRYRRRADTFERLVASVQPDQWSNQSPCAEWDARGVVQHIIDMHGVIFRPLDRDLSPAPSVDDDPLAAFRAARADVESLLDDPDAAQSVQQHPTGPMTTEDAVDGIPSADFVFHGWDLARATGQDDTIDPADLERMWPSMQEIDPKMRIPGAFGPGVVVFGPEVPVPEDAPRQDRMLGLIGRDPSWKPS